MKYFITFLLMHFAINTFSQMQEIIYLWPEKVPGEIVEKKIPVIDTMQEKSVLRITEVTNPLIEVFIPRDNFYNGSAVVICPGGGYNLLAYDKEGTEIAEWFNKIGVAAFVLQYRVPNKRGGALQDVQRAIRIIRKNSEKWKINPDKIGVMGFSAGGNLSARAATRFHEKTYPAVDATDSLSCRPAFAMLIYPAYLDEGPGKTLTPELTLSNDVPPFFMFQTADDRLANSPLVMAAALRDAKLPVEIHILPAGGHGYGMRPVNRAAVTWPGLAEMWLKELLFIGQ